MKDDMSKNQTERQSKIKLSMFISPDANDDELLFAQQLGVPCVYTWVEDHQRGYEFLVNLRQKVDRAGLTLYNVGNMGVAKSDKIHLALSGRD